MKSVDISFKCFVYIKSKIRTGECTVSFGSRYIQIEPRREKTGFLHITAQLIIAFIFVI